MEKDWVRREDREGVSEEGREGGSLRGAETWIGRKSRRRIGGEEGNKSVKSDFFWVQRES